MGYLIINADDYGYSAGVNYGIIDAHQKGILTSTTMMANMSGFEEGVLLAKENPNLGIGVHLTLTCGSPISDNVSTLINENKEFHNLTFYEDKFEINLDELYQEWKSQIDKIISSGIQPTHLDSHHHVNSISPIDTVFIRLAKEYNLPVRNNFDVPNDVKTTGRLFTAFDSLAQNKNIWKHMDLNNLIGDCKRYDIVEAMCHPAYVDAELMNGSSLNTDRTFILQEIINLKESLIFRENDIQLVNYEKINNMEEI